MTRFGWGVALLLAALAVGFAAIVRVGEQPPVIATHIDRADVPSPRPIGRPGKMMIPVEGVRAETLTDSFGDARGGGARVHGALDIPAPRGTPVIATAPGLVEKIFESEAGGHTVYVRSPEQRWTYYYAHLDGYAPGLAEGDYVTQGQRIGFVGSTGDADPAAPHLHFEVKRMAPGEKWYAGQPIDPYPLLTGR